jgi:hypothetical protein
MPVRRDPLPPDRLAGRFNCKCRMSQRAHAAPAIAWLAVPYPAFEITVGI